MFNNLLTKFLKIIPVGFSQANRSPLQYTADRCVTTKALAHPIRSFEVGMALQSCPTLGQGPLYFGMDQSLDAGERWLKVFFG